MDDPYAVLGVRRSASQDDIRRAWVRLARRHHPDRGGDAAAMQAVNAAWTVLGDPGRRAAWDREHLTTRTAWRGRPHGGPTPPDPTAPDVDDSHDVDDLLADLLDPRPLSPVVSSRLDLVPPGLFAVAVLLGCLALALDVPGLLAAAALVFFFSCIAVAAVAMLAMRRSARAGRR